jgi:hypothetical protein
MVGGNHPPSLESSHAAAHGCTSGQGQPRAAGPGLPQEGHIRGLEAADILKQVLDLVGLPIEGVRANLHDAPVVDPFRATR